MKRSESTEMARLLRRYARPGGEALRGEGAQKDDSSGANEAPAHLDADELNAYAEGALPEAARLRYSAHLADCDACRKLVTDLTLAASRFADEGKLRGTATVASTRQPWRDWLATIFSPPVLRYGVPALALFAIIVVAIFVVRTQREASFVAQNDRAERSIPQTERPNYNSSTANTTTGTTTENHSDNKAVVPAAQEAQATQPGQSIASARTGPKESTSANISQAAGTKPAPLAPGSASGSAPGSGESKQVEEVESLPPAPTPPPAQAMDTAAANKRAQRDEQPKAKVIAKDDDEAQLSTNATAGGTFSAKSESNEARAQRGRATASRQVQNLPAERRSSDSPKNAPADEVIEKKSSAETRSVGGRKFRRQGDVWVDTEYKSSLPTTNVARGSEQYRALVADEPELRTITQQLGGEVFVVWKHRAYRFY